MEDQFIEATSENLPGIYIDMILPMLENEDNGNLRKARIMLPDCLVKNIKIKRYENLCTILAKIDIYSNCCEVSIVFDEKNESIILQTCSECYDISICLHVLMFLLWLEKETHSIPPSISRNYYKIQNFTDSNNVIKIKDIFKKKFQLDNLPDPLDYNKIVENFNADDKSAKQSAFMINHQEEKEVKLFKTFDMNVLIDDFTKMYKLDTNSEDLIAKHFIFYLKNIFNNKVCRTLEKNSFNKDRHYWYKIKYGRITPSKCYEIGNYVNNSNFLIESLLGGCSIVNSETIFKNEIKKNVAQNVITRFPTSNLSGIFIDSENPIYVGRPDLINENQLFEIKIITGTKPRSHFIKNEQIEEKYYIQMQMLMKITGIHDSILCLVNTKKNILYSIDFIQINYNENFLKPYLKKCEEFWMENIFKKLYKE